MVWCSSVMALPRDRTATDRVATLFASLPAAAQSWQTHTPQGQQDSIALSMRLTQAFFTDPSQRLQDKTLAWQSTDPTTACPALVQRWSHIPEPPDFHPHSTLPKRVSVREQLRTVLSGVVEDYQTQKTATVTVSSALPGFEINSLWDAWQQPINTIKAQWSSRQEQVQVMVNGAAIATLSHTTNAEHLADQIRYFVNQPDWDATQLEPTLMGQYPAIRSGHRLMVVIDDAIVPPEEQNRELLAIDWTNNLRQAFGVEPLELVTAQQLMYGIRETREDFEGIASWYGPMFHGRLTANGETYNQDAFTAAHPHLPFNTYLKVINLESQEAVIVRINDRGPYIQPRTLDLSRGVARCIESKESGVVPYRAIVMSSS